MFKIRFRYNRNDSEINMKIDSIDSEINMKIESWVNAICVSPVKNHKIANNSSLGYFIKLGLSHISFVTDLNLLASRISKEEARREKNSAVDTHGTEAVTR